MFDGRTRAISGKLMVTINRAAIVVRAKQPFLDCLHRADETSGGITLADLNADPAVYLLPEGDDEKKANVLLRRLFTHIFEEQLHSWYTDRRTWPRDRSFDTFCGWFDWQYHSML